MDAVDANPIAAVLLPRTVHVAPLSQVNGHVGAALCRAEKQQISRLQELIIPGANRHWAAKPFLLVGISR
jgi:hypothetical protein